MIGVIDLIKCNSNDHVKKKINQYLYHYAVRAYRILSYVMLVLASYAILFWGFLLNKEADLQRGLYISLHGLLLTGTVIYICYQFCWQKKGRDEPGPFLNAGVCYAVFLVTVSSLITCMQLAQGKGIHLYLYAVLLTAVVIALKPWQSILLYFASFILLQLLLPVMNAAIGNGGATVNPADQSFSMDFLFLASLAAVISSYLEMARCGNYMLQVRMEEENQMLCEMNERLKKEVVVDKMTGLYNRRYLADNIQQKLKEGAADQLPVACMMVDVDFFKQYNDKYGHQKGDECLIKVAQSVQKFFYAENVRVIRYGGEEFLIVIFDCTENEALQQADRLRKEVEKQRIIREDIPLGYLTVSIGVYAKQLDGQVSFRQLIEKADAALYRAKADGRNRVKLYNRNTCRNEQDEVGI